MHIINNQDRKLLNELRSQISEDSRIFLSCNYFTAYAMFEIVSQIDKVHSYKILLSNTLIDEDDFRFIHNDTEQELNLQLDRKSRLKKVSEKLNNKVEVREGSLGNQNVLLIQNKENTYVYSLTPLNFDSVCLGTIPAEKPVFINAFEDSESQYLDIFKQAWSNSSKKLNHKIYSYLSKGLSDISGESIYKYCIRDLFKYSTIDERAEQRLQKTGFKDSRVWKMLYNFQKDAVIGAIEKIETYGGSIIADSVGLGKTFEALAVMKYYQLRNDRILVLAPKKLRENWTIYQMNDKRNILADDRLNYDVLNHTDLSRERGKSGDIDLEMINWGNYDLVVIDESHNFRNNPTRKGVTRYQRLMKDVIKANIKTKVLMLSATPVNNRMNDLKNQIAFITEGNDRAFHEYGIRSIAQVMKDAQRKFTKWYRDGDPDNLKINELMLQLDGSYFKILDMLTIARSRKHIEKYYDTAEIGEFPERLKPDTVYPDIDTENRFQDIGQIYDEISTLTLAAYSPLGYVRSDKKAYYEEKYDMKTESGSVFKQLDREKSLIYLMRVNMLKRLESSVHSFKLTLEKLITFIEENLRQVNQHQNGDIDVDLNITDIDLDDTDLADLLVGGKTKVLIQDIDLIKWKQHLKYDKSILESLLSNIQMIGVNRDAKLLKLKDKIAEKLKKPINPGNKKVIIFTAFADTANFLYHELNQWIKKEKSLNSALVTGAGNNKTNMPGCRSDLASILTNFSPVSKNRQSIFPDEKDEIDVLFCTDCISEGQNLQDCDFLVNYDIHWNPVRIIQRFGRIDRIGSTNKKIQLVNFYPSMELDSFIDLVARVQGRMVMLDVSATGEDNIISKDSRDMQDLDYRKQQLKQLQSQVIDLEDVQGNITITDLTFNDFKMDLEKSTEQELEVLDHIPPASYALVKSNMPNIEKGVIFCLKDTSEEYGDKLRNNIIYPYFLVYVSMDGREVVKASNAKQTLDYFRKLGMGHEKILPELIRDFQSETRQDKNMKHYRKLLQIAIDDIVGVKDEIGLDSLATPGGTSFTAGSLSKKEDLKLIAWLIIK